MSVNQTAAIDALTEPGRETLDGRTVTLPPLLVQLRDAVANSGERTEGVVPSSTPPLDVGALDLWTEIAEAALEWAASCDIDPGPAHAESDPRPGRRCQGPVPDPALKARELISVRRACGTGTAGATSTYTVRTSGSRLLSRLPAHRRLPCKSEPDYQT